MSEATVNIKDVPDLLAPSFKEQLVRVVWDENKATLTVIKKVSKRNLKAYNILSAYADHSKIASEKNAWLEAVTEKHGNS